MTGGKTTGTRAEHVPHHQTFSAPEFPPRPQIWSGPGAEEAASREPHRPVCITGRHRTGTSVVAGLLQRHGLWLGDEADIMPADPYNPDGYFENNRLVEVNDAILSAFGGRWDRPPDFPTAWTEDPRIAQPKEIARAMGERLDAVRPW